MALAQKQLTKLFQGCSKLLISKHNVFISIIDCFEYRNVDINFILNSISYNFTHNMINYFKSV